MITVSDVFMVKALLASGTKFALSGITKVSTGGTGRNLWKVGSYKNLRGAEVGLDAHHVGQKAVMKQFVP